MFLKFLANYSVIDPAPQYIYIETPASRVAPERRRPCPPEAGFPLTVLLDGGDMDHRQLTAIAKKHGFKYSGRWNAAKGQKLIDRILKKYHWLLRSASEDEKHEKTINKRLNKARHAFTKHRRSNIWGLSPSVRATHLQRGEELEYPVLRARMALGRLFPKAKRDGNKRGPRVTVLDDLVFDLCDVQAAMGVKQQKVRLHNSAEQLRQHGVIITAQKLKSFESLLSRRKRSRRSSPSDPLELLPKPSKSN